MHAGTAYARRAIACTLIVLSGAVSGGGTALERPEARIVGNWLTEDKDGIIQIVERADGRVDGRIVGGSDIDRADLKNPEPGRRGQMLRGEVIIVGLRYDGDGKWSGGTVYDPENGRTYRCRAELISPDTLRFRGFVGFAVFGQSQTWTRYTGPVEETGTAN